MADNQMIKIEFDFDLGNVPASAKKFSQYLKDVNVSLDFTKKSVKELGDAVDQTAQKMNNANGSLKKSNQQWTNLALVIQDLPYGFRGIQNNLPALLGGIAGVTGPLYLAFSAIIAGITMFDQSLQGANKTAEDAYKKFHDVKAETEALSSIFSAVRMGTLDAKDATDIFNKELGNLFDTAKNVYEAESLYIAKTGAYVKAQYLRAKADIELEKAKKALADGDKAGAEDQIGILGRLVQATASFLQTGGIQGVAGFWKAGVDYAKTSTSLQTELVGYELNLQNALYNKALAKRTQYLSDAYKIEKKAGIKSNPEKDKKGKLKKDNSIELLKAKQQYYKDDILMFNGYEQEILKLEEDLAVKQARIDGQGAEYIKNIHSIYDQLRINSAQSTADKILAIQHKLGEDEGKENEKIAEMQQSNRELLAKSIIKINSDFAKEDIKNVKAQLDSTLKATKGNYQAQKDAIQLAIAKLTEYRDAAKEAGYGTKEFDDAIKNLGFSLDGLVDPIENFNTQLTNIINNTLSQIGTSLGEAIGDSLLGTGGLEGALNNFLSVLATGLIQVGELAISTGIAILGIKKALESLNPYVAIAAGIALVALGTYVKGSLSKKSEAIGGTAKFADGGIVSGPTYGLMGEYPGAKNNPEVIAPLDKLKSMIGGGGSGEFVLRGNDLVLALQRSNSSLTLRR
jgi:ElaB/YqjD/DUF883 family membrane-anchored ribosome-binding protein